MSDGFNPYQSPAEATQAPVDFAPAPVGDVFRNASFLGTMLTVLLGVQILLDGGLLMRNGIAASAS